MKYFCNTCGYVYDEELGDTGRNIAPGTLWRDLPESWRCPVCSATSSAFFPFDGVDATEFPESEELEEEDEDKEFWITDV